ncbi:DNA photolyase, FAD-binding/Cryptochrome [Kockovaella imperatae]|uniref:DNA photolyase, FAD-binding/Cryptochrome n=1 Tax=Kockovaella imperatae TaxID=4999 RepID=A0A1Y1US34_9TREE|nr:DNA photolyase, FAD-binding/Cryptochrome [Kockovaella imperatae]ORX40843.1 DNA photolyase, FAD-binding/Cryptochrome [Kockovaella imperatae]
MCSHLAEGKVATAEVAAKVDEDPPLDQLMRLVSESEKDVQKGDSVVYWMRMEDVRIEDNTAFALAGKKAEELGVPLIVLYVLSPGDYTWHDRSSKKIDFILRNLRWLKPKLDELNIPLYIKSYDKRLQIPRRLVTEVFPELGANHVFCNIEYQIDELRRDIATVKRGREKGIEVVPVHDRLVVPPGKVMSKAGKPLSVYSPWQRAWADLLSKDKTYLEMSDIPKGNDASLKKDKRFGKLFDVTPIPDHVEGFELKDSEEVHKLWPEGTDAAKELLHRFLHTKARKQQLQLVSPLSEGAEEDDKKSRLKVYQDGRNLVDGDHSSRLSPYLASGVISGRMVLNEAKTMGSKGRLETGRDTGLGMWVQEVAWRDFYNHVMAIWPRVSMGRPFLEKFADVQWEVNEDHLQAWKDGKTGYPIVDAAMRACAARGWMENRVRMVTACFLVKDLMLDWRLGEKHFMQSFIDGDLAANNGGWQWTASTGTDPQPYFRIFNTLTQSEKCDPNGDYIRYWVPELKNLKGKAIHDPFHSLPSNEFKKLGYPAPIVDHKKARERALFRYKNVGEKEDDK